VAPHCIAVVLHDTAPRGQGRVRQRWRCCAVALLFSAEAWLRLAACGTSRRCRGIVRRPKAFSRTAGAVHTGALPGHSAATRRQCPAATTQQHGIPDRRRGNAGYAALWRSNAHRSQCTGNFQLRTAEAPLRPVEHMQSIVSQSRGSPQPSWAPLRSLPRRHTTAQLSCAGALRSRSAAWSRWAVAKHGPPAFGGARACRRVRKPG
jgi:hypothetical protein